MAKIEKVLCGNENKLIITEYLDPSIRTEGVDEYVTIRRIPYSIRRKMDIISFSNLGNKTRKMIFDALKKTGKSVYEFDSMTNEEKMKILAVVEINADDMAKMVTSNLEIVKMLIENGVDKTKHSFVGQDDKPIEIGFELFETIGNSDLVDFLVREIKELSDGYQLGEKTATI